MAATVQYGRISDPNIERAKDGIVGTISKYVDLKKAGKNYAACCPFHSERTPSFTVSESKGIFHCFGCGAGGDAIDFVMQHESLPFHEAVQSIVGSIPASGAAPKKRQAHRQQPVDEWQPVVPVPASAGAPIDVFNRRNGDEWEKVTASTHWPYPNSKGELIGYVSRFDIPSGGKDVLPQSFCVNSQTGEMRWKWLSFAKPRPLYGLDKLAKHPSAQVIVVEGEKACDKAQALFEEALFRINKSVQQGQKSARDLLIVVSWPGGGKAVKHVDWSPLAGRNVGLWPDADQKHYVDAHPKAGQIMPFIEQPGTVAMFAIANEIVGKANTVKFITPPTGVSDGWDLGDDLPEGFDLLAHTKANAVEFVKFREQNAVVEPEPAAEPASEQPATPSSGEHVVLEAPDVGERQAQEPAHHVPEASNLESFWSHLPSHKYIFVSTGELWPSSSVNGHLPVWPQNPETEKPMKPSEWLDRHRAVQQMSWHPGRPRIVEDEIVSGGGWARCPGARVFNLYRAPDRKQGNAEDVALWLNHLKAVYPNEWQHIQCWMAHRIQCPGEKINHALVLGGSPGIGKDTILEPVKMGVGSWNWSEVSPQQIVKDQFNPWVQSVVARISELRDLKEDRFGFYETMKVYTAAPPDTLRINQKHIPEYYVPNVMGVIFTTNNRTDGLYLPAEDRRHYVAWSEVDKEQFDEAYWKALWDWIYAGGAWNVVEYLRTLDLSGFNCKAPPERTAAFWAIVHANNAPEDAELFAVLGDEAVAPDAVVLEDIIAKANAAGLSGLADELSDRKARRSIPHKLGRAGYVPVHNPDAKDGLWAVGGKRVTVYAKKSRSSAEQILAARQRAAPSGAQPSARYQPASVDYSQPPT